jgi:DNA-binding transcriptional regulator GbsR (MarR family)
MANNKTIISDLNKAINSESRKVKVQAIFEHSGDELEDVTDWVEIAGEELSELNERLQNIINYYNN